MVNQLRLKEGLNVVKAREVKGIFEMGLVMEGQRS